MAIEIVTSWRTLFRLAGEEGEARIAFRRKPTAENKALLEEAIARHDEYKQLCLESDRMIHFPQLDRWRETK